MKILVSTLIVGLVLHGMACVSEAQIRDDEASATVLSVQCAVSSGFSATGFEEYSRSLAKTLGLLTGPQQVRVFGYLPQPAAFASGGSLRGSLPVAESEVEPIKQTNQSNELSEGLDSLIERQGDSGDVEAVGGDEAGGNSDASSEISNSSPTNNANATSGRSVDGVRAWFSAAEEAFKAGTLREFLSGGQK